MKKYKLHFIRPQLFSADILATVSGCSTTEISSPNLLKDTTPGVVTFANPTQSAFGTTSKTKEQIEQALREGERARVAGVEARRAHRESASVLGALEAADNFERIAREDGQTSHQMSAWELQASLLILLDRFGEAKIKLAQKRDLTWSINNNLNALVFLKTGEIEKARELFNPKTIYRNVKDVEDRPKFNTDAEFESALWLAITLDTNTSSVRQYDYMLRAERLNPNNPAIAWYMFHQLNSSKFTRFERKLRLETVVKYGKGLAAEARRYLESGKY